MLIDVLWNERPKLLKVHPLCRKAQSFLVERLGFGLDSLFKLTGDDFGTFRIVSDYSTLENVLGFFLDEHYNVIGQVHPDTTVLHSNSKLSLAFWNVFGGQQYSPRNRHAQSIKDAARTLADPNAVRYIFVIEEALWVFSDHCVQVKLIKLPNGTGLGQLIEQLEANRRKADIDEALNAINI